MMTSPLASLAFRPAAFPVSKIGLTLTRQHTIHTMIHRTSLGALAFDSTSLRLAKKNLELSRRHEAIAAYIRGATPPAYRPRS